MQREGRMMIFEGKDTEDENGFRVRDIGCNVSGLGYALSVNDVCKYIGQKEWKARVSTN